MEAAAHQYSVHEAKTHLSRILEQVATGEEVVISKAGMPVAKVVPLRPAVKRRARLTPRCDPHCGRLRRNAR